MRQHELSGAVLYCELAEVQRSRDVKCLLVHGTGCFIHLLVLKKSTCPNVPRKETTNYGNNLYIKADFSLSDYARAHPIMGFTF